MKLLNSYVGGVVLAAIGATNLVVVGLVALGDIIDEMGRLEGDYGMLQALLHVALRLPGIIHQYLPVTALIGCLFGLGSLASTSELTVMRAAGVSIWGVLGLVFRPVIVLVIFGLILGQYIVPKTEQIAESRKALALYGERGYTTKGGVWSREGNTFMHFSVVQPNGVLYGISLYDFDEQMQLRQARYADRGSFQGDHWLLEKVVETTLSDTRTDARQYDTLRWDSDVSPGLLSIVLVDPMYLPLTGLWQYAHYLDEQGQNNGDYLLAFWNKALQPLTTVSLVLLASSFIFGPLRSVTAGFRVFVGAFFGVVFKTTQEMLGPAALVFGFSPIYASLIPALVCLLLGVWLLRRQR